MIPTCTPCPVRPESQTEGIRIIRMSHWRKENRSNRSVRERTDAGEKNAEDAKVGTARKSISSTDNRIAIVFFIAMSPP